MKNSRRLFKAVDALLIFMIIAPIAAGMALKILTSPPSDGITISGAQVYFTIPMPLQPLLITESQVNSWLVIVSVFALCLYLTHGIKAVPDSRRQYAAEWIVEKVENLTSGNMGDYFASFSPFIAAVLGLSGFSSLITLFGMYPPTSDINVVGGWALCVFILITYYKLKCGFVEYLKGFAKPVPLLMPLNIISEIATPVSMAFRHYGNILSGSVISVLVAAGLRGLSELIFGWLPGVLGEIPFLQIGLPAVLSVYFDVFSGCLQAFIFAMLTMLYVSGAFPLDEYVERSKRKKNKNRANKTIKGEI